MTVFQLATEYQYNNSYIPKAKPFFTVEFNQPTSVKNIQFKMGYHAYNIPSYTTGIFNPGDWYNLPKQKVAF